MSAIRKIFSAARGSLLLLALLFMAPQQGVAGDVDVRTANIRRVGDVWALTARIDYQLTQQAQEALDSGVTLTFRVEILVNRVRSWLPDPEVLSNQLDWQLSFDPLTKRYLVRYPDGREPSSHGTLFGAVNALGRLQSMPIGPGTALSDGQTYDVAVRALLSQQNLPGPLRVLAFWDSGFSLESDWYEWTLAL